MSSADDIVCTADESGYDRAIDFSTTGGEVPYITDLLVDEGKSVCTGAG